MSDSSYEQFQKDKAELMIRGLQKEGREMLSRVQQFQATRPMLEAVRVRLILEQKLHGDPRFSEEIAGLDAALEVFNGFVPEPGSTRP